MDDDGFSKLRPSPDYFAFYKGVHSYVQFCQSYVKEFLRSCPKGTTSTVVGLFVCSSLATGHFTLPSFFTFFKKIIYLFIMALLGLHCCVNFSRVAASWGYSHGAQASHCSGFSCCSAQALRRAGFSSCSICAQ